jgi:hypothetical protein
VNKRTIITHTFRIEKSGTHQDYIHEYTERIEAATFGNPSEWIEGLKYFERDSDGAKLNRISETEFYEVATGETLTVTA